MKKLIFGIVLMSLMAIIGLSIVACDTGSGNIVGGGGGGAGSNINISEMTFDAVMSAINAALAVGNATVTGSATDLQGLIHLTIPAGRTLNWHADVRGTAVFIPHGGGDLIVANGGRFESHRNSMMISLDNFDGRFIVETGGEILNTYTGFLAGGGISLGGERGSRTLIVRGGVITGYWDAILVTFDSAVYIESGTVRNTSVNADSTAIDGRGNARIKISGGTITTGGAGAAVIGRWGSPRVFVSGTPTIAPGGIRTGSIEARGYWLGSNNQALFLTDGSARAFTIDTDLFYGAPANWQ